MFRPKKGSVVSSLLYCVPHMPSFTTLTYFKSMMFYFKWINKTYTACSFHGFVFVQRNVNIPQPAFTCSKLTIETLEQGV